MFYIKVLDQKDRATKQRSIKPITAKLSQQTFEL